MSHNTQSDSKELSSIVQPGSTLQAYLPDPLFGELELSEKPVAQGAYSDIYRGLLKQNGVETAVHVCVKKLRKCGMEGKCADPNITVEDRFERVRCLRHPAPRTLT